MNETRERYEISSWSSVTMEHDGTYWRLGVEHRDEEDVDWDGPFVSGAWLNHLTDEGVVSLMGFLSRCLAERVAR